MGEKGRAVPRRITGIIAPASLFPESLDRAGGWRKLAAAL